MVYPLVADASPCYPEEFTITCIVKSILLCRTKSSGQIKSSCWLDLLCCLATDRMAHVPTCQSEVCSSTTSVGKDNEPDSCSPFREGVTSDSPIHERFKRLRRSEKELGTLTATFSGSDTESSTAVAPGLTSTLAKLEMSLGRFSKSVEFSEAPLLDSRRSICSPDSKSQSPSAPARLHLGGQENYPCRSLSSINFGLDLAAASPIGSSCSTKEYPGLSSTHGLSASSLFIRRLSTRRSKQSSKQCLAPGNEPTLAGSQSASTSDPAKKSPSFLCGERRTQIRPTHPFLDLIEASKLPVEVACQPARESVSPEIALTIRLHPGDPNAGVLRELVLHRLIGSREHSPVEQPAPIVNRPVAVVQPSPNSHSSHCIPVNPPPSSSTAGDLIQNLDPWTSETNASRLKSQNDQPASSALCAIPVSRSADTPGDRVSPTVPAATHTDVEGTIATCNVDSNDSLLPISKCPTEGSPQPLIARSSDQTSLLSPASVVPLAFNFKKLLRDRYLSSQRILSAPLTPNGSSSALSAGCTSTKDDLIRTARLNLFARNPVVTQNPPPSAEPSLSSLDALNVSPSTLEKITFGLGHDVDPLSASSHPLASELTSSVTELIRQLSPQNVTHTVRSTKTSSPSGVERAELQVSDGNRISRNLSSLYTSEQKNACDLALRTSNSMFLQQRQPSESPQASDSSLLRSYQSWPLSPYLLAQKSMEVASAHFRNLAPKESPSVPPDLAKFSSPLGQRLLIPPVVRISPDADVGLHSSELEESDVSLSTRERKRSSTSYALAIPVERERQSHSAPISPQEAYGLCYSHSGLSVPDKDNLLSPSCNLIHACSAFEPIIPCSTKSPPERWCKRAHDQPSPLLTEQTPFSLRSESSGIGSETRSFWRSPVPFGNFSSPRCEFPTTPHFPGDIRSSVPFSAKQRKSSGLSAGAFIFPPPSPFRASNTGMTTTPLSSLSWLSSSSGIGSHSAGSGASSALTKITDEQEEGYASLVERVANWASCTTPSGLQPSPCSSREGSQASGMKPIDFSLGASGTEKLTQISSPVVTSSSSSAWSNLSVTSPQNLFFDIPSTGAGSGSGDSAPERSRAAVRRNGRGRPRLWSSTRKLLYTSASTPTSQALSRSRVPYSVSSPSGSRGRASTGGPHICPICCRQFTRSDMLVRHAHVHTGHRPFECPACGQAFSRSDHLSTHQRTHTGQRPYRCPLCTYSACRRDMITRHLRVHQRRGQIIPSERCSVDARNRLSPLRVDVDPVAVGPLRLLPPPPTHRGRSRRQNQSLTTGEGATARPMRAGRAASGSTMLPPSTPPHLDEDVHDTRKNTSLKTDAP
ncbi:unnamed protein product [Calicophoron daubneyi]|uniref:C2H2-type domain-containing protein n=1 Tax=Calicophoron daubneyi TaxID=300641 RepID=A0AAV2TVV7_CALDB